MVISEFKASSMRGTKGLCATFLLSLVAACGGGGGGSTATLARTDATGAPLGTAIPDSTGTLPAAGSTGSQTPSAGASGASGSAGGPAPGAQQLVSAPFQVNAAAAGLQLNPRMTRLADGGFAITWTSQATPGGDGDGVFVRRFASDGTARGGDVRLDDHAGRRFEFAEIAGLADGGFVAVWREESPAENDFRALQLRRYSAGGTLVASRQDPFPNTANVGAWGVVALPDGGYVRTSAQYDMSTFGYVTYLQRFSASNQDLTGLVQIGPMAPAVSTQAYALNDGTILLVWDEFKSDTNLVELWMQRFSADGQPIADRVQIAEPARSQSRPIVAALSNGDIALAWRRLDPALRFLVVTRRFGADLRPVGAEQLVDAETDVQRPVCVPRPDHPGDCPQDFPVQAATGIAEASDGNYVVSWHSLYRGPASWARTFDATGTAVSSIKQVEGDSLYRGLVGLPNGRIVNLWAAGPTLDTEVFARAYYERELR
jgi:hypothetical protein